MLVVMWVLTRNLFPVAFEWGRLALLHRRSRAGSRSRGSCCCPTDGVTGFVTRALALAAIPAALYAARFFRPGELLAARRLLRPSTAG